MPLNIKKLFLGTSGIQIKNNNRKWFRDRVEKRDIWSSGEIFGDGLNGTITRTADPGCRLLPGFFE